MIEKTNPNCFLRNNAKSSDDNWKGFVPFIKISPDDGESIVDTIFNNVVFPLPDGPHNPYKFTFLN